MVSTASVRAVLASLIATLPALAACGDDGDGGGASSPPPPVGEVAAPVGIGTAATVSPDGRWLAYAPEFGEVCLLELVESAEPTCVAPEAAGTDSLAWSADSSTVVTGFDLRRFFETRVHVIGTDATVTSLGAQGAGDVAVARGAASLDGDRVVFLRVDLEGSEPAELVASTLDGDERVVTELPSGELSQWPVLVADDHFVVNLGGRSPGRIVAIDEDSGELEVLAEATCLTPGETVQTCGPGDVVDLAAIEVVDDGLVLALDARSVFAGTQDAERPAVFLFGLDSPGDRVSVQRDGLVAQAASVSPDGERLAVVWRESAPSDTSLLGVADVADVRGGSPTWDDLTIEGLPYVDFSQRIRWTSEGTVTMILDGRVATVAVS